MACILYEKEKNNPQDFEALLMFRMHRRRVMGKMGVAVVLLILFLETVSAQISLFIYIESV